MKKFFTCLIFFGSLIFLSESAQAQGYLMPRGYKAVNFGLDAGKLGGYIGFDFKAGKRFTWGPRLRITKGLTGPFISKSQNVSFTFRTDYHYASHIPIFPEELDLYGGLSFGMASYWYDDLNEDRSGDTDPAIFFQTGGRWFFANRMAANVEFKGGLNTLSSFGSVGLTWRFGGR